MEHVQAHGYYGWRGPGLPGLGHPTADTSGIKILASVDPSADMPPIVDQGQLGSCTANATARIFQGDTIRDGHDFGPLSRLDIYYDERDEEGTLGQGDTGAYGHDAFKAAQKWGIVPETVWPYDIATFEARPPGVEHCPPNQRYWLKKPVKAVPPTLEDVKRVLSNGQKIAVGFTVYESFESASVARTGIVPMPRPDQGEQIKGGHEVVLSGYEPDVDISQLLWCDNSWDVGWGQKGRFLIPVAYILARRYAGDWRTIQRAVGA